MRTMALLRMLPWCGVVSTAELHSNSMVPFCWPNHGVWDYIGDNVCIWAPGAHDTVGHADVPPPKHALDSAGTRLPTLDCCDAEFQLALRTDISQTVRISFDLAPGLQGSVPEQPGVVTPGAIGASVRLEAGVSQGLRLRVTAAHGVAPGSYSASVRLHPANISARCITWGPWSCARPFVMRLAPPKPPVSPPLPMRCTAAEGSCHGPRWSWASVGDMAFVHTSNGSGVFNPHSTKTLAKFASFTWDGSSSCRQSIERCAGAMERTQLEQFALLKMINPNISTIFYHDSARAWTLPNAINVSNKLDEEILQVHPEYYLLNTSGDLAIDPYEQGISWTAYDGHKGGCCEVYNLAMPAVRKAWISMALAHFNSSGKNYSLVDGVFADDGAIMAKRAASSWGVTPAVAASFTAGHTQLLKEATTVMSEGRGLLVENGGPIAEVAGNAYMFETFAPNNETIKALFELAKLGKIVQAHTDYYSGEENPSTYDSLAAFLIGASPGFYWSGPFGWESFDDDDVSQRWLPEFDQPLGVPLGPAVFEATTATERWVESGVAGRWTRHFKSGTMVEFVVEPHCRGTIRWGDGSMSVGNGGCDETPTAPPGAQYDGGLALAR